METDSKYKTYEEFFEKINSELLSLEARNIKYLYMIQEKIPTSYVGKMKAYLKDSNKYILQEARKCKQCKSTWDIIIEIRK